MAAVITALGIKSNGFYPFVGSVIEQINKYYATNYEEVLNNDCNIEDVTLFLMALGTLAFSILLLGCLSKKKVVLAGAIFIIILPLLLCIYCGVMPDGSDGLVYLASVMCYLYFRQTDENTNKKEYIGITLTIAALILLTNVFHYRLYDYSLEYKKEIKRINNKIAKIEMYLSEGKFDKILDELGLKKHKSKIGDSISKVAENANLKLPGGLGGVGIPGDIKDLSIRSKSNHKRLEVNVYEAPSKPLYLKSFTGITLQDKTWIAVNKTSYDEFVGHFFGDEEIQFIFQQMKAKEMLYSDEWSRKSKMVNIVNVDDAAYNVFEPYLSCTDKIGFVQDVDYLDLHCDAFYRVESEKKYHDPEGVTFHYFENGPDEFDGKFKEAFDYFLKGDSPADWEIYELVEYLEYIWDFYVDGSQYSSEGDRLEETIDNILQDRYISFDSEEAFWKSYYEIIDYVQHKVFNDFKYTLQPGKPTNDEGELEYFLKTNKKGFCVHYATVTTLLLQQAGIPARYVEGYVVSPGDFKKNDDGLLYAEVTDDMGHAWCEVFGPNGWTPIETTPYYEETEIRVDAKLAEQRQKADDLEEKHNKEKETTNVNQKNEKKTTTHRPDNKPTKVNEDKNVVKKEINNRQVLKMKGLLRVFGVFSFLCLIWLQAFIRKRTRYRKYKDYSDKKSVLKIYNSIAFLCEYAYGLELNTKNDEDTYLKMKQNVHDIDDSEWDWIYETANEVVFYTRGAEEKINDRIFEDFIKIRNGVWQSLNPIKKMALYFIFAI